MASSQPSPSGGNDPTIADIADGFALWEEWKPLSVEDWVGVAERWLADCGGALDEATPLFKALVEAVRQRDEARDELERIISG